MSTTPRDGKGKVILSIDIGSSSVRCSAYSFLDNAVEALVGCSSSRPIQAAAAGTRKETVDLLLECVDSCVDETLEYLRQKEQLNSNFRVIALGFSAFVMNLVGINKAGHPVDGAMLTYSCNSPLVTQECQSLRTLMGLDQQKDFHQRTGCPIHSAYALPQLRVFYKTSTATTVHLWHTLSSYIVSRWLGQWSSSAPIPVSVSEASWTGLLNVHTCEWDEEVLSHLPPSCVSALPPLQDFTTQTFFGVTKYRKDESEVINPYWSRWPELREEDGCQIFLGVGDGAAATLGSKCYSTSTTAKRISVTIGTSAAIRLCRNYPRSITACKTADNVSPTRENKALLKIQEGLWCYRVTNDLVILGGALTDGGSVIEFCRTLLNLKEDSEFTSCMEQVQTLMQQQQQQQSDSNDIIGHTSTDDNLLSAADSTEIFLPFLGGERSIGFRPGATASLCGITHRTTPARFVKSCMEGITIQLNEILMLLLNSFEGEISEANRPKLVVSGSALERNQTWRQMIADCTELDVVMDSEVNECTSRGVAILIATTLASQWQKSTSDNEYSKCFMFGEEEIVHPIDICYASSASNTYWSKKKNLQKDLINSVSRTWVPSFIDKPTM